MSNQTMQLLNEPPDDMLIKDSLTRVRDQLAQVPEGKTGALVLAVDWKGMLPTFRTGVAMRTANGWEIHGEGFISKASKGASVRAVKTWVLLFCLLLASPAFAQTPIPTNYTLTTHFEAAPDGAPISSFDFAKTAAQCDQPIVAVTGVQANPRFVRWTDPERPGRDCVLDTTATSGPLFAMPFGGRYIGKLTAKVIAGGVEFPAVASAASNPFVRGAAPVSAAAVRVGG